MLINKKFGKLSVGNLITDLENFRNFCEEKLSSIVKYMYILF